MLYSFFLCLHSGEYGQEAMEMSPEATTSTQSTDTSGRSAWNKDAWTVKSCRTCRSWCKSWPHCMIRSMSSIEPPTTDCSLLTSLSATWSNGWSLIGRCTASHRRMAAPQTHCELVDTLETAISTLEMGHRGCWVTCHPCGHHDNIEPLLTGPWARPRIWDAPARISPCQLSQSMPDPW